MMADEDLLLQLFVEKATYNTGEDVFFTGLLSMNSYPIVNAQICVGLQNGSGGQLWGACGYTDEEGYYSETLSYGSAIPTGYVGYLILTATGVYDEQDAYSEMFIPYGVDLDDEEEDGELSITVTPLDKLEFIQGDNVTVAIDAALDGVGLAGADIYAEVRLDDGTLIALVDDFTDGDGHYEIYLEYGSTIPMGYSGTLSVWAKVFYYDLNVDQTIQIPYQAAANLPLKLEPWGPAIPVQIGGWEVIQIGGTVTSQGALVDGATVVIQVYGSTYQTTTGSSGEPGKFYYGWSNDTFPAGQYPVQIIVSKPGYETVVGAVTFTVFGQGYDFAAVFTGIKASYDPNTNVPFPGLLTLGGTPISDWIDTEVTYPDGTVETFVNLTEADGSFMVTIPNLTQAGTYQMVVFYQGDRKQISQVYSFDVGKGQGTQGSSQGEIPSDDSKGWYFINVNYPKVVTLGETITLTGTLVTGEDENQVPLPDIPIQLGVGEAGWGLDETWDTVTNDDGTFSFSFTLTSILYNELNLIAKDEEGKAGAVYFGAIETIMNLILSVSTNQGSYQTGEKVTGIVDLIPEFDAAPSWDDSLEILIQITGPTGTNETTYTLGFKFTQTDESGFLKYGNQVDFWWVVPETAESGTYRVDVVITGKEISRAEGSTTFSIEVANTINFEADFSAQPAGYDFYETAYDPYYPGRVFGQYMDHEGYAIDHADVRIIAVNTDIRSQTLELKTTTDQAGEFNQTLEALNCLVGNQRTTWELTVYADKEGYSTGAEVIFVETPIAKPRMEIIEADPLTNDLELQSYSGNINYTQEKPYNIRLKVKYTTCESGTGLWVNTKGDWALKPDQLTFVNSNQIDCENCTWNQSVSINGDLAGSLGFHDLWDSSPWTNASWTADIWLGAHHDSLISLEQGIGKEVEVTLSGGLFNFTRLDDEPGNDPASCVIAMPKEGPATIPPYYGTRVNLGKRGVVIDLAMVTPDEVLLLGAEQVDPNLFSFKTGIAYPISDLGLGQMYVNGTAWVGTAGGNLKATIGHGGNAVLPKYTVQLQPMVWENDPNTPEPYEPTDLIKVQPSVITDENGYFSLPLEFVGDPCDYKDKTFQIKVSAEGFKTDLYDTIPVTLRCVENMAFKLVPGAIHVVQAPDLTQEEAIQLASGKETGVRAYIAVDGDFMQPVQNPIRFNVKFELVPDGSSVPVYTQLKTVSLTETGARVGWAPGQSVVNQTAIGYTARWENDTGKTLGSKVVPVDFVFTPYAFGGNQTSYTIRITVDPGEVYGKKVEAEKEPIAVKVMKRLRILFVPVQRPYTIFNMDYKILNKQLKFLASTYPLAPGDIGWSVAPNFEWDDAVTLLGGADKYTYLGRLALALGDKYGGGSTNYEYRVVGIVDESVWLQDTFGVSNEASGAQFGNGVTLVRYPKAPYNTLAHEIGHTLGLYYTTWLDKVRGISKEQYVQYPSDGIKVTGLIFRNGSIYDLDGDKSKTAEWREAFENADSVDVFDLMGSPERYGNYYQAPWVIPSTYTDLFDALKDPPGESILKIRGGVDDQDRMVLEVLSVSTGHPDPVAKEGYYQLKILDVDGAQLYQTFFDVKYGEPGSVPIFSLKLPSVPGMARVVVEREGQAQAEVFRSANVPTVSILQQPQSNTDEISLSWQGDDLDGDSLRYELSYQCGKDDFWQPLDTLAGDTQYTFNTTWLAGGDACRIKVTVSDGFNTGKAVTDPFSITTKAPLVEIYNEEGAVYPAEEAVILKGFAMDLEDGTISEEGLFWSSNPDGDLGYGSDLPVILSPGTHLITLTIHDTDGFVSRAEVTITVDASITNDLDDDGDANIVEEINQEEEVSKDVKRMLLIIGLIVLALMMLGAAGGLLWFALRKKKPAAASLRNQQGGDRQPGAVQKNMVQDTLGGWWYQDPGTGAWSSWNGTAWLRNTHGPKLQSAPSIPQRSVPPQGTVKSNRGRSCIFTMVTTILIGVLVLGGISLVAFNILHVGTIHPGDGELISILKNGGSGFLVTLLGGLLINGGFKAIITQRTMVADEWGRKREKRGGRAVLNGLGGLVVGLLLMAAGLSLTGLTFFKDVLPFLGF